MIINANAFQIPLANDSVQCCVTSPPYWNQRRYFFEGAVRLRSDLDVNTRQMVLDELTRLGVKPKQ